MCRFTLYLGPRIPLGSLVTEPSNSLIHQSFHSLEREEPLNGDGFGVAWYCSELSAEPGLFRSISPAWNNRNLLRLAKLTRSQCILAHVRAASRGSAVVETNCHPFCSGPFAFMHNGHLGGFPHFRRKLLETLSDDAFRAIEGTTDSEHVFAVFLDRMQETPREDADESMAAALQSTLQAVLSLSDRYGQKEYSFLNLAVSDGRQAVVSRFTNHTPDHADSLYFNAGSRYTCEGGVCRMLDPDEQGCAVVVSSEPLSEDWGWQEVPVNHLVVISKDRQVDLRPLRL